MTYLDRFARIASYLALNVSSPNTAGLRGLQKPDALAELLGRAVVALAPALALAQALVGVRVWQVLGRRRVDLTLRTRRIVVWGVAPDRGDRRRLPPSRGNGRLFGLG